MTQTPLAKVIITAAGTGNLTTPGQTPYLPITPAQIATACLESAEAGAAIVHIHVRDPETGASSMALDLYRETMALIRARNPELVLNITTGPGGRFVPSAENPAMAAAGTTLVRPKLRVEHIVALWPEIELFDSGDISLMQDLLADATLQGPLLCSIVMGVLYGLQASPETILYARTVLPPGTAFTAFGIGRHVLPPRRRAFSRAGMCASGWRMAFICHAEHSPRAMRKWSRKSAASLRIWAVQSPVRKMPVSCWA